MSNVLETGAKFFADGRVERWSREAANPQKWDLEAIREAASWPVPTCVLVPQEIADLLAREFEGRD